MHKISYSVLSGKGFIYSWTNLEPKTTTQEKQLEATTLSFALGTSSNKLKSFATLYNILHVSRLKAQQPVISPPLSSPLSAAATASASAPAATATASAQNTYTNIQYTKERVEKAQNMANSLERECHL